TPPETLNRARAIARERLRFVYVGNVAPGAPDGDNGANTVCPGCGAMLVRRHGYRTQAAGLDAAGRCARCGADAGFVVR
ncbi:MAG: AmmeMemoRadiSam system radical SAM enzyme, partial [Planctomycetes bacterium]|nr:AmmeMemoRadiSam system radical SAM enzyme [Planctomycetota bacterium]